MSSQQLNQSDLVFHPLFMPIKDPLNTVSNNNQRTNLNNQNMTTSDNFVNNLEVYQSSDVAPTMTYNYYCQPNMYNNLPNNNYYYNLNNNDNTQQ